MGSRAGDLPAHLRDGRGSFSGPFQGGYIVWVISLDNLANSESPEYEIVAPCDLRIMRVSTTAEAVTSDPEIRVLNNGTAVVALADYTVAAIDHTLVAAQRNVAKDDLIQVRLIADASDTATGSCVTLTAYTRGHVFADDAND